MLTINHTDFRIEISDEPYYSMGSTDNLSLYEKEYYKGVLNQQRVDPISKHGIRVKQNDTELSSILIGEEYGATTIHEHSFLIANDHLLICCCSYVYSLKIPSLEISWRKRLDPATCFGIYAFGKHFIIHGELSITQIDAEGHEKWTFGGRDIFVTPDGTEAIRIHPDNIELTDWEGYQYVLDASGSEIQ